MPDGAHDAERPASRYLAGRSGQPQPKEVAAISKDSVSLLGLLVGIFAFGATMLALGFTLGQAL
jgi:hypothetical protein